MPAKKKATKNGKAFKKAKEAEINSLLKKALSKLKEEIGEKKLERKIKKAAKIFAEAIKFSKTKTKKPSAKKSIVSKTK